MIYIKKDTIPPSILVQNKNEWTKELKDNIKRYGGYENIPQDIKNSMWIHYRHLLPVFRNVLFVKQNQPKVVTLRLSILSLNLYIQIWHLIGIIFCPYVESVMGLKVIMILERSRLLIRVMMIQKQY